MTFVHLRPVETLLADKFWHGFTLHWCC